MRGRALRCDAGARRLNLAWRIPIKPRWPERDVPVWGWRTERQKVLNPVFVAAPSGRAARRHQGRLSTEWRAVGIDASGREP